MANISTFEISVEQEFQEYINAALLRLGYIYPHLEFSVSRCTISVKGNLSQVDKNEIKREVLYQIYREKIFNQTLPMRENLYKILTE